MDEINFSSSALQVRITYIFYILYIIYIYISTASSLDFEHFPKWGIFTNVHAERVLCTQLNLIQIAYLAGFKKARDGRICGGCVCIECITTGTHQFKSSVHRHPNVGRIGFHLLVIQVSCLWITVFLRINKRVKSALSVRWTIRLPQDMTEHTQCLRRAESMGYRPISTHP